MNIHHLRQYLQISSQEVIAGYGIRGGVPRYWEIRKQHAHFEDAVRWYLLDQNGLLYEEPEQLFSDDMRTSVQAFSI